MSRGIPRGFTLIEVVVALAILGVGLIVIIELFSGGLRLGKVAEEYTQAISYARLKMEDLAAGQQLVEGMEEGEFDKKYRYQIEVKKVDLYPFQEQVDFQPPLLLYKIKLSVLWKSGLRERSADFESFRTFKPEEAEAKT